MTITILPYISSFYYIQFSNSPILKAGSSSAFKVKLSAAPTSSVTLTFTASSYLTYSPSIVTLSNTNSQDITVTAALADGSSTDVYSTNIQYTITTTDPSYRNAVQFPATFNAYLVNDYSASVYLYEDVVLQEGNVGEYYIILTRVPTATVTVTLTLSNAYIQVLTGLTYTFTSTDSFYEQTVKVQATSTAPAQAIYSTTITHTVTSADSRYGGSTPTPGNSIKVTVLNPCRPGFYSYPPGSGVCKVCPQGKSCINIYAQPVDCASGEYSPIGETMCIPCPAGYACTTGKPVPCPLGTTAALGVGSCTACTGSNCYFSGKTSVACPSGTYISSAGRMCHLCPAGFECTSITSDPVACTAGKYSRLGEASCNNCPANFYCPDAETPFPIPCPAGYYSAAGATVCTGCPVGSSCSSGTSATSCAAGTFSLGGSDYCGTKTYNFGCTPGQYLNGSTCTTCPVGYYCDGLSQIPCWPGFYQDQTGQSSCKALTLGFYGDNSVGATSKTAVNIVNKEYVDNVRHGVKYCPSGTESIGYSCKPCDAGTDCSNTGIVSDYSNPFNIYQSSLDIFSYCPDGLEYSSTESNNSCQTVSANTSTCKEGFECPAASKNEYMFHCAEGYKRSAADGNSCVRCTTAGKYCPIGSPKEFDCIPGYYCPGGGWEPIPCPYGTYSESKNNDDVTTDCTACAIGYYCPQNSVNQVQCPLGYYLTSTSQGSRFDCTICDAGYVCDKVEMTARPASNCGTGAYCLQGTWNKREHLCPAGTLNGLNNYDSASDCTGTCPARFACRPGTDDIDIPKEKCAVGHYCPVGTFYSHQNACAGGTYTESFSLSDQSECTNCPAGASCMPGQRKPSMCEIGFYCPQRTTRPDENPCPAGKYSDEPELTAISECSNCPAGSFCPSGSSAPRECPVGSYAAAGLGSCTSCPSGNYCPKGSSLQTVCPNGYISVAGSGECQECYLGYRCSSGTPIACSAGKYCPWGTSTTISCPAGYYCPAVTTARKYNEEDGKIPCEPGKFVASTDSDDVGDCDNIPLGEYTLEGYSSRTGFCHPGYYCPAGSRGPFATPCPRGKYRLNEGAGDLSDCENCPEGYYCPTGTAIPIICPVGFYCPVGVSQPEFCAAGTIGQKVGLKADTECTDCPAGSFCTQPGLTGPDGFCAQGYQCGAGTSSSKPDDSVCPAGGYCEPGLGIQLDCPPGSYNPNTGAKDSSWCLPCPAGKYCEGDETDTFSDCEAGFYCPTASYLSYQKQTPPGYYTEAGDDAPDKCATTTYNDLYMQSECKDCPAGYYCNDLAMIAPKLCPEGYYCEAVSDGPAQCPVGTFAPVKGFDAESDCIDCSPGFYCATAASTEPTGKCAPGYFCEGGSEMRNPTGSSSPAGQCFEGHYCPQQTYKPIPCPPGKFREDPLGSSLADCSDCWQGYFCGERGLTEVDTNDECQVGYFCDYGERVVNPSEWVNGSGVTQQRSCDPGQMCPVGSDYYQRCDPGTYQINQRQGTCTSCPAGYYCNGQGNSDFTSKICPTGSYCPAGTKFSNSYQCKPGTYNPITSSKAISDCLKCPPGKYCQGSGLTTFTANCDAGYYCRLGSSTSNPQASYSYNSATNTYTGDSTGGMCIKGYYCPSGVSDVLACKGGYYCDVDALGSPKGQCSAGYYCISKATTSVPRDGVTGNICPPGAYCPVGSVSPIPCVAGKYSGGYGNDDPTDCLDCIQGKYCGHQTDKYFSASTGDCAEGYFCVTGTKVKTPLAGECTPGYHCVEGAYLKTICPTGTYQDLKIQGSCNTCPSGYYCPTAGTTLPAECTAGNYCPAGANAEIPCPAGTYNPLDRMGSKSACVTCQPGKYCTGGQPEPDGDCASGYYCTGGADKAQPDNDAVGGICRKGTYCPAGSTNPTECDPGKYCSTIGLGAVTGDCNAGFYCLGGAQTATPKDAITGNICPYGYYCEVASIYPKPCPRGSYSRKLGLTDVSECTDCVRGSYCNSRAGTSVTSTCMAGYTCPGGDVNPADPAQICLAGTYCPQGSYTAKQCPAGRFSDRDGVSSCSKCPASFFCALGEDEPQRCTEGSACPLGTSDVNLLACQNGAFQPFPAQGVCLTCPLGYYCDSGTITDPTICPANKVCTEGTSSIIPSCPSGTYSTHTNLQSRTQCTFCPAGKYCLNGVIVGNCSAGYLCVSGSNTATPNGFSNTGKAFPCPEGHYCLAGAVLPTPCPEGKFRRSTGGTSADSCVACDAGYYCILNDPIPKPCLPGTYCPAGTSEPNKCPSGTYSKENQAISYTSCLKCPAGYLCDSSGIANFANYPCRPGYYCTSGAVLPTVTKPGLYSPGHSAGSESDLLPCPGGYYCNTNTITYIPCPEGTYCPQKSTETQVCPRSYYCPPLSLSPTQCPAGWYCDDVDDMPGFPPYKCPEGTICPAGSRMPDECVRGTKAIKARSVYAPEPYCLDCPKGTFGDDEHIKCLPCSAGYVCLGKTKYSTPKDILTDNGYQCPAGFYCPEGSWESYPCGIGKYNPNPGKGSITDCLSCPANTYTDTTASVACLECGEDATAPSGSSNCVCKGKNRVYFKQDDSCVCEAGYEYITSKGKDESDKSGTTDCSEEIFGRCADGEIRNQDGDCVSKSDCNSYCDGDGSYDIGSGMCLCDKVDDVNTVCNAHCRSSAPKAYITVTGHIRIEDPETGETSLLLQEDMAGYSGSISCTSGNKCPVQFIEMSSQPTGLYGVLPELYVRNTTKVADSASRNLQETSTEGIRDPVICLNAGETMFWNVSPDHYPVYYEKSLTNSNKKFDFSVFIALKSSLKKGKNLSIFGFTFNDPGTYVFHDSADISKLMVIGVMTTEEKCPYDNARIQPRTESSLHLIGAKLEASLILEVNWEIVIGLMILLLAVMCLFTGLFYYYAKITWKITPQTHIPYRAENMKIHIQSEEYGGANMHLVIEGQDASSGSEAEDIREMIFEKQPDVVEYEPEGYNDQHNQIDTSLIQAIKNKIYENHRIIRKAIEDSDVDTKERMNLVETEARNLRELINKLITPIENFNLRPGVEFLEPVRPATVQSERDYSRFGDIDYQEDLNEISSNSKLIEQDKQKLMDELSNAMLKLEDHLKEEKTKHDSDLERRLAERKAKRKDLAKRRRELEQQQIALTKQQADEVNKLEHDKELNEEFSESDYLDEKSKILCQVGGERVATLQKQLQDAISKNPHKEHEYMAEYEREMNKIQDTLNMNQLQQKQELMKRLEEKRRNRKKKIQQDFENDKEALDKKHAHERLSLKAAIDQLDIDEAVDTAIERHFTDVQGDKVKELEQKHKEELKEAEKQIREDIEKAEALAQKQQGMSDQALYASRESLEKQKEALEEALKNAPANQKTSIIEQLQQIENELNQIYDRQKLDQRKNLENRLEMRRKKRAQKLEQIKQRQEEERKKLEVELAEEANMQKAQQLDCAIQAIVSRLPDPEMKNAAIKELLADKHERELAELRKKLRNKLRDKQRKVIQSLLRDKASDIEAMRMEMKERYKNAGKDSQEEIQRAEAEAMNRLDYHYLKKIEAAQDQAWKEQQKENHDELLKLIDDQLLEMRKLLSSPDLTKDRREIEQKLAQQKDQLEVDLQKRLADVDRRKEELQEIKRQKDSALQELIAKEREEEERRKMRAQLLEKRKALFEEQNRQRKELMQRGELTKEQIEKLIKRHQDEILSMEKAMEKERQRQMALLSHKLAEKRSKKAEYLESVNKMHEEQNKIAKILEELPSLNNKQAASLLSKWRRYPKKLMKDIEVSVKSSAPVNKELPKPIEEGKVTRNLKVDDRLRNLLTRIERIEEIVTNVDKNQFSQVAMACRELSNSISWISP
jgi:hypothetical protein